MEISKFNGYKEFKAAFDHEVKSHAESYLKMGYLLKVARDTDILFGSGYKSIAEFAQKEYRLSDDVVSKMIAINDKYSEGGYSDRIMARYQGFGMSLLAEMLTLPDHVVEAIPEGTKREEIREIKKEIREEEKITPIEVMMEPQDPEVETLDTNLAKFLHRYFKETTVKFKEMHKLVKSGTSAVTILAPSGIGVLMARIPGLGKFMLSIKGSSQPVELLNTRSGEQETYTWEVCSDTLKNMCSTSAQKDWERLYGEPMPGEEKKEIPAEKQGNIDEKRDFAPAQEKEPKMPANPHKTSTFCDSGEKAEKPVEKEPEEPANPHKASTFCDFEEKDENVPNEPEKSPETRMELHDFENPDEKMKPVQKNIGDFDEVLPPGYIKTEDGTEVENTGEQIWQQAAGLASCLNMDLETHSFSSANLPLAQNMRRAAETLLGYLKTVEEKKS